MIPTVKILPVIAGLFLVQGNLTNAQTFLFDFGATAPTGGAALNSPGHAVGGIPNEQVSWNTVQNVDIGSGILTSAGGASGISINLGLESAAGSNTIDFSTDPTGIIAGSGSANGSLYAGTSPAKDGIFSGVTGSAVGLRIDGLAAGEYTLYFTARNTNTVSTTNQGMRLYGSTAASAGSYDFSSVLSFADVSNTNTLTNAGTAWDGTTLGVAYNFLNFTIASGESLFVAVDDVNDARGFINSLEIVAVPEPGTMALFIPGLGVLYLSRRRKGPVA